MQNVENLLKSKADDGTEEMTIALRERADAAGWPLHISSNMSIVFDGENLGFDYPPHLEEDILNLEYGTINNPPSSVMRGIVYRIHGLMDEIIDEELLDTMVMSGEVLHG